MSELSARKRSTRYSLLALVGFVAALAFFRAQRLHEPNRFRTRERTCETNLKVIAFALHAYHEDHGSFPPAYVPGADGEPAHSWRVLLLPYLEQEQL